MFAYCDNNPVARVDYLGTDSEEWKTWVEVGLGLFFLGCAILLAVPSGGGSFVFAGVGIDAAAVVTVGEVTMAAGTAVAEAGIVKGNMPSSSAFSNKYEQGSRNLKNGTRVDYEYNGNGTGNVHIHSGKTKAVLWVMERGVRKVLTVSGVIKEIVREPEVQDAVTEFIRQVRNLAEQ